jgi:hypothetical protein
MYCDSTASVVSVSYRNTVTDGSMALAPRATTTSSSKSSSATATSTSTTSSATSTTTTDPAIGAVPYTPPISKGAIAGIVVGSVAAVTLAILAFAMFQRRRRRVRNSHNYVSPSMFTENGPFDEGKDVYPDRTPNPGVVEADHGTPTMREEVHAAMLAPLRSPIELDSSGPEPSPFVIPPQLNPNARQADAQGQRQSQAEELDSTPISMSTQVFPSRRQTQETTPGAQSGTLSPNWWTPPQSGRWSNSTVMDPRSSAAPAPLNYMTYRPDSQPQSIRPVVPSGSYTGQISCDDAAPPMPPPKEPITPTAANSQRESTATSFIVSPVPSSIYSPPPPNTPAAMQGLTASLSRPHQDPDLEGLRQTRWSGAGVGAGAGTGIGIGRSVTSARGGNPGERYITPETAIERGLGIEGVEEGDEESGEKGHPGKQ